MFRLPARYCTIAVLVFVATAAGADLAALDPAAKPYTKLGPGFQIALNVSVAEIDEKELCGVFPLDNEGRLEFTLGFKPMEKLSLRGLTAEEARKRLLQAIKPFFAVQPDVRLGIAKIPRFQVVVTGYVYRSGVVELPDGSRLSDLLAEVGYFEAADLHQVTVRRTDSSVLHPDFAKALANAGGGDDPRNDPLLQNGDVIQVPLKIAPPVPQKISVLGEVQKQGSMPYKKGMTVKGAIETAILSATADRDQVILQRPKDNNITYVNLPRALKNEPTDNLVLNPDDLIFVMRKDTGLRYAVLGAVPAQQTFDYKKQVTLRQAIMDAGGFKPNADRRKVMIARNGLSDPSKVDRILVDFDRIARGEAPDPALQPGDIVQIPEHKKQNNGLLEIGLMLLRFLVF